MAPTCVQTVTVPASTLFEGGQPLDLIGLVDVKTELQLTDDSNDAWLQKVITRASRAISNDCTRVFQPQWYQELIYPSQEAYPWQLPPGFFPLQLSAWPLLCPPSPAGTPPPLLPTLGSAGGGALAAAKYFVRVTYVTPSGETAASMEASLSVAANNLLTVQAPQPDEIGIATGWNVYVGGSSFQEILQNTAPLSLNENFTLATTGLVTKGESCPNYILAVENNPSLPQPLAEGIDFESDYNQAQPDFSKGWLTRLFLISEQPRRWPLPVLVNYQAGYSSIPDDLSDACLQLVKAKWFARNRDPMLRTENVAGVYEATYWFGPGPGAGGQFPPDVQAVIDRYRVPVIA